MLYGFLVTIYSIVCVLLVLLILAQKGKSSMGLGGLGTGTQLLFGGSGGQDLFQKITWTLASIFMGGSLILALMKSYNTQSFNATRKAIATEQLPVSQEPSTQSTQEAAQ